MSQESVGQGQSQKTAPRSKWGCLWKGLLVAGGMLLLLILLIAWQVASYKTWLEDGMESTPAVFPEPQLSQAERQGLDDLYGSYRTHYEQKKDVDVLLTPAQLNSFATDNIAKEKAEGRKPKLEALQFSFDGPQVVVRGSGPVPDHEGLYHNFEVRGAVSLESGDITWQPDSIRLRGKEAPFFAKLLMRWALKTVVTQQKERFAQGQDSIFARLKLARREGDKIHLIMDGRHLEPPDH